MQMNEFAKVTTLRIGLIFFSAVEPMKHFVNPINLQPGSTEAINFAMQQSFINSLGSIFDHGTYSCIFSI